MTVNIKPDLFEAAPSFLPILLPGETLYSWCARYHRLSGNHLAAHTSKQLFGSPTAGLMQDFPSHLSVFVERSGGLLGDIEALAHHHTLLGFYTAFRPAEVSQSALASMAGTSVERLKFRLGLPASRLGATHPLKACPVCMLEDQHRFGNAYWHLEHQWPAVWACLAHQQPLWSCAAKTKALNNLQWLLPGDIQEKYWNIPEQAINSWHILERMADFANQCQQIAGLHLDPKILRQTYLVGLKQRGWLTRSGMIRMIETRTNFLHQAHALEAIPGFEFIASVRDESSGFLGVLLRAVRGHKHPVKHLLLMAFLFSSWQIFWEIYQAMLAVTAKKRSQNPLTDDDPRRQRLTELIKQEGLSVSESARRLGVKLDLALFWARQDGLPYRRRPRAIHATLLPVLHEALSTGENRDEVAKRVGISVDAVTRFLNSHPDLKTSWTEAHLGKQRETYRAHYLAILAENPGASLTFLRTLPGCGYKWLYRNDRDWLSEHLPSLWQTRPMK
ncbi:TnsD family Tn7-like transposition protein [Sulfurirhabdus autotrophica]|uniref:TniQ protein n=1 Tax=Sulfurirhabdus autotrophica TaxID=1706046 RepID=A0A4R3XS57_9PROT|nr:TnsD family Tn7-like transposition protein [Sulfurirhabdus autotrophica]TCV81066.1 TniQ protein [Sulfurirhabdus autotrophica]